MCDTSRDAAVGSLSFRKVPVCESVGMVLGHDITEIRKGEFKGRAFRKGHVVRAEDVCHLQRLGKEHLFVLTIGEDEMHEDEAAFCLAAALMGEGIAMEGEPKEGKINVVASRNGLLTVNVPALRDFNMLGEVMCATLHTNTVVRTGQVVAGTRAIPLVIKKSVIEAARAVADRRGAAIRVKELRRPRAGVVITGNEVYSGRVRDAFAPIIEEKIAEYGGEVLDVRVVPDDEHIISRMLCDLMAAGADLLITTGGMSVDPDDVTRFAVARLGATDMSYGSAVLPGAMFLVAYIENPGFKMRDSGGSGQNQEPATGNSKAGGCSSVIPVLGIPACGMYHRRTAFDLVLPRVLAGERIGRAELAELGHGGFCLNCRECRYPVCPFGK